MGGLAHFFQTNLDAVHFFYGAALVLLGLTVLLQPRKPEDSPMTGTFHLLGWASITHGASVFVNMWELIRRSKSAAFALPEFLFLLTSYCFLFEFGRRSIREDKGGCATGLTEKARRLGPWVLPALIALVFGLAAASSSFVLNASVLARYLVSFPGTLLAGAAFLNYSRCQAAYMANPETKKYFMLAGFSFIAYGLVGGLVPPKAGFFPASALNSDSFLAFTGFPVQLFRAACAGLISWGVVGALRVFNWQRDEIIQGVVFNNSRDCIANISLDGRLLAVNKAFLLAYGMAGPWELQGKNAAAVIAAGAPGLPGAIRRAAKGEASVLHYSLNSGTGRETWWDAAISQVRGLDKELKSVLCMAKDITSQHRQHETQATINEILSLAIEDEPLENILGRVLDRILAVSWLGLLKKGAILLTDPAGKYLFIKAQRGLDGQAEKTCTNVPLGRCLCGKAALSGETIFADEVDERHEIRYEGMLPHGHYCLPIKSRGKVMGVLTLYVPSGYKYEQSEREFLEAVGGIIAKVVEYKNLESKAQQSQKMESLGRFAGAIAHDFRNILTGIKGFNSIALETLPDGSDARKYLLEAAAGIDKGGDLIRQILAFSRSQPAEMSALDLNAVIAGVEKMLQMVLEKKVRLILALAPGLPPVLGNKNQLEQVLVNLAVNAHDAMPDGGDFTITTQAPGPEVSCPAGLEPGQKAVRLSLVDTGSGIPENLLERAFEPFFTTKPEGKGTGLGLPTVYSIIKLHKGAVSVTSPPGRGTTFEICLPAAARAEQQLPAEAAHFAKV